MLLNVHPCIIEDLKTEAGIKGEDILNVALVAATDSVQNPPGLLLTATAPAITPLHTSVEVLLIAPVPDQLAHAAVLLSSVARLPVVTAPLTFATSTNSPDTVSPNVPSIMR